MQTTLTTKLKLMTTSEQLASLWATQLVYRDGLDLVSQYAFAHSNTSSCTLEKVCGIAVESGYKLAPKGGE